MDIMSYLLGQNSGVKKGMKVIVVDELPTTGEVNVLYLVPKQDTGENDIFEEWLYVEDEWEKIGTTDIDLSNYYTKSETIAKMSSMPTASADYVGTVVLYIGTTTSSYTNGRFYIGISTGEPATYSWSEMTVQDLTNYYTKTEVDATTGNLANLATTAKTNLVSAINELAGNSSPIQLLNVGDVSNSTPSGCDANTVIKSLYGESKVGTYLLKGHITYDNSDAIFGLLFVSLEGSQTRQSIITTEEKGSQVKFSVSGRKINNSTGALTQDFAQNEMKLYGRNGGSPNIESTSVYIARIQDLKSYYGDKKKSDLTTTTKTSLVDAINEVNTKINNLVDANNTSY